jgi:hypothetical protein
MRAISALLLPTASFAFTSPRFQRMATRNLGVRQGVKASDVLKTPVWPEVINTPDYIYQVIYTSLRQLLHCWSSHSAL